MAFEDRRVDPTVLTVADKLAAIREAKLRSRRGQYIAVYKEPRSIRIPAPSDSLEVWDYPVEEVFALFGGGSVNTYKTIRGARKAAGDGGFVCVLDLSRLPIVDGSALADGVDDLNEIDELSFAERQMLIWSSRVQALGGRL